VAAAARASASRFATVSQAARHDWAAAGIPCLLLRNGVPDFRLRGLPVQRSALIAGRISPEKGTAVALRVARAAGLEARLVGTVYDREYHAREVGVPVQPVPRAELWRLMERSAVTLMPVDWEEPFGLVAAESQLAGCPVAGYRRGALPEVVPEGIGGFLVDPGDEPALVRAAIRAQALDRAACRASARRRLLIGPVAEAYEAALA